MPRKVSPESRDTPRHQSGARLENRFCSCDGISGFALKTAWKAQEAQQAAQGYPRKLRGAQAELWIAGSDPGADHTHDRFLTYMWRC